MTPISCEEREIVYHRQYNGELTPSSSITNFIEGLVADPRLPRITATTWCDGTGRDVLRDERDIDGCRHYLIGENQQ